MAIEFIDIVETSLAGLGTGSLMALTGVAFVIIYKATKVINLAIGEMLMIGAFVFYGFSAGLALPIWASVPATLVVAALIGGVIERTMIRPLLKDNPVSVFMVTIGLTSVLIGVVELVWSAEPRRLPEFLPQQPVLLGDAFIPSKTAYSFLIASAVMAVLITVFAFWRGGIALRATATDRAAASSVGIDVPGVFSFSWMLAATVAALAGILVGSVGGISSAMGLFGLSVFVVVIVGGLDSILGALIAGLFIGWLEAMVGRFLGGEFKLLATFSILLIVLVVRPYGLFGTHEIERL
ncbi:branched-chain amino acid ABC transporter permease [Phreatobacter oligotrophus]|uniref:Amino acid/amide ABC transporter membrane protein 1 (HAAT family) n=1 Tax=Phreatobacter oligotrophus TaxID=1122261 RepID=A0A2T4YXW5_9HYPH|nr:branched-chain amino acid ABC transporter permease [Phreatobacter oligotrophus]PTM51361.1 amino acid/amide ABC transporter membrane protein 1 (HAAT family) [Phreatobacter oligotrophus]